VVVFKIFRSEYAGIKIKLSPAFLRNNTSLSWTKLNVVGLVGKWLIKGV